VQSAFVDGMNAALTVGAGIAVAGFVLTLIFLPNRPKAAQAVQTTQGSDTVEGAPAERVELGHEESVTN
jgi:hypothetical protein